MPDDIQTHTPKNDGSLTMQIYAAFLGGHAPRIQKPQQIGRPRMNVRVRLETVVEAPSLSPFHKPTWREQIERAAGIAVAAIDEARQRLQASRAVPPTLTPPIAETSPVKPIVLIGPAAKRKIASAEPKKASTSSRAA